MDLDKYKTAWNNQPEETNKVSKLAIYKMAHSSSSSVVKWIFIIGVLEFIFVATINNVFRLNPNEYEGLDNFIVGNIIWAEIISYLIMLYFLIQFYLNFKSISTSDNTKILMKKILKVRKTVKRYVFVNVGFVTIISLFVISRMIYMKDFTNYNLSTYLFIIMSIILLIIVFILLYWLLYQLLYGILLRKLNKNYKELTKFEDKK